MYFRVDFSSVKFTLSHPMGFGFQTITGIEAKMETETIQEGGENMFEHRVPGRIKYENLVLKRGMETLGIYTPLVKWCMDTLTYGLTKKIETMDITVNLLNEFGTPSATWRFIDAYPVRWVIGEMNSLEAEVLIEEIEFCYQYAFRVDGGLIGAMGKVANTAESVATVAQSALEIKAAVESHQDKKEKEAKDKARDAAAAKAAEEKEKKKAEEKKAQEAKEKKEKEEAKKEADRLAIEKKERDEAFAAEKAAMKKRDEEAKAAAKASADKSRQKDKAKDGSKPKDEPKSDDPQPPPPTPPRTPPRTPPTDNS